MRVATQHPGKKGFTLIEVLVVIAIIALLMAILLPSLHRARSQARRVACYSNMRQIYLAYTMYKDSNGDRIPDWIAIGKWHFRRAPGMKDPTSPTSLQETFGLNALLAGVGPVETGNVAKKKKFLSGYSEAWQCPASPGWMWDQWRNTYATMKLTVLTGATSENIPSTSFTKLMMRVKKSNGNSWDPSKIPILQDNWTFSPGLCGWIGTTSWSNAYKLPESSRWPPHAYKANAKASSGFDDVVNILWLDGNAGRNAGKRGL